MYYSSIPEGNINDYLEVKVDDRIFFCKKDCDDISHTPKRRYSNHLKDPLFIAKDKFKELNMLKQFRIKYKDIETIIKKYIDCIERCIEVLNKEFGVSPKEVFTAFNLERLGFNAEDFGIEKENEF